MERRIKIIYDGGVIYRAKIVDADTGELILGITQVDISMSVNAGITATIYVRDSPLPFCEPRLEIETKAAIRPEQE